MHSYKRALFPDQRGPGDNHPAPRNATGIAIDLHSYSEYILWNSGPNGTDTQTLSRKFGYFNQYDPGFQLKQLFEHSPCRCAAG